MANIYLATKCLLFLTVLFQMSSSQTLYPLTGLPDSPQLLETEVLCKDLASAIQSVILSKMKRNVCKGPSNPGMSEIVTQGCSCPVCSNNWKSTLSRVLGMPNSYGQNAAVLSVNQGIHNNAPISSPNVVSAGLNQMVARNGCPFADQSILQAIAANQVTNQRKGCPFADQSILQAVAANQRNGCPFADQSILQATSIAANQRNGCPFADQSILQAIAANQNYKASDLAINNAISGNLAQRSIPNGNGNKFVELVFVKGSPLGNSFNRNALV